MFGPVASGQSESVGDRISLPMFLARLSEAIVADGHFLATLSVCTEKRATHRLGRILKKGKSKDD